jgi:hypothetical protein
MCLLWPAGELFFGAEAQVHQRPINRTRFALWSVDAGEISSSVCTRSTHAAVSQKFVGSGGSTCPRHSVTDGPLSLIRVETQTAAYPSLRTDASLRRAASEERHRRG